MKACQVFLFCLVAISCGCDHKAASSFERYGLAQTPRYRTEVAHGIKLANASVPSVDFRLEPGWETSSSRDKNRIPVYVVSGTRLGKDDKIFVPDGERFIIVNADCIPGLPTIFREKGHPHTNGVMAVSLPSYIGLIFLHELGHIALGHQGSHASLPEHLDAELNLIANTNKSSELAADRFAAEQIRSAPSSENLDLRMALFNIVWNINVWRSLEYFGSDSTFVQEVYWDAGTTHPNLAFRMLIIADMVAPSKVSAQMLQMYVDGRARQPWNKVFRPITTIDEVTKIAANMGYRLRKEVLPDRVRFHIENPRRGIQLQVDELPGEESVTSTRISEIIGLKF